MWRRWQKGRVLWHLETKPWLVVVCHVDGSRLQESCISELAQENACFSCFSSGLWLLYVRIYLFIYLFGGSSSWARLSGDDHHFKIKLQASPSKSDLLLNLTSPFPLAWFLLSDPQISPEASCVARQLRSVSGATPTPTARVSEAKSRWSCKITGELQAHTVTTAMNKVIPWCLIEVAWLLKLCHLLIYLPPPPITCWVSRWGLCVSSEFKHFSLIIIMSVTWCKYGSKQRVVSLCTGSMPEGRWTTKQYRVK